MKLFSVVAALLSLAYGTSGQEPSRATTVPPITERRIVWEEWKVLSECQTTPENYICASQRTGVSVAIALNTGICTATVGYVSCLETTCTSSPALRESITRIRDRCQGSKVKSTSTITQIPSSTTRATPRPTTGAPTSTTRRGTRVYRKSIISEIDLVDNEWSKLTTCRFLGADDVCDLQKKTLQSSLIIEFGVCGSALTYINCLETNCHSSSDLDASIQRVRNRCNGQTTVVQDTTTNAPSTAAPTTSTTSTTSSTPRPTLPTTQKTTTQIPETDLVIAEWNTLASCHLVDDEEEETCDGVKEQLQEAVLSEYGVCASAIDYVDCLEKVCMQTYSLTNSISRVRSRCSDYISNGPGATSSPNARVSDSDLVSNEWHALTTCSFIDEEKEEECEDAKTGLQDAVKYDSGVCEAAITYVDCLQYTCRPTHIITDSITRVRTQCNGVSQPDVGTPGGIVSDEDFVSKEWHTLSTCALLDPEEEDCGEPKEELQDALRTGSEVCEAASGYVECLEEACLLTHTLTESLNKIKTRCDGEGGDPEENPNSNFPGTLGSESTVVNSEIHTLTTCALLDPEEEDCGEQKTDLQDALRSNEDVCGAALEYVECLEEACLVTHSLTDSFIRIKNRCGGEEEEDD